ncbi:MAG: PSD1 and planctomycete cytochrome C domain-containing protein [Verrucomicrobiota bacterium]
MKTIQHLILPWMVLSGWLVPLGAGLAAEKPLSFSSDIRPLISKYCVSCHGPDKAQREADLRLDTREGAYADLGGYAAIVSGKPDESEFYRRLIITDKDDLMPPPDAKNPLSPEDLATFRRWISEGGAYEDHWAFAPPVRTNVPEAGNGKWGKNPIDAFIMEKLNEQGLEPQTEASPETLVRRAYLTLTGLPPSPGEVEAFLKDTSADAYEALVDRLLKSKKYGEHRARFWLDAARYGDTHGLHLDNERAIWPYRDWVVEALNDNMPFDQFTIEQLAGDLLPEPNLDQLVATGFNRCNVTTSEGGAIAQEFAVRYGIDRISTLGTVWMGLTTGCSQCHDHKFDPITQKDFYQLFAFYNNLDENAMDGNAFIYPPTVQLKTDEDRAKLAAFDRQIEQLDKAIKVSLAAVDYQDPGNSKTSLARKDFVWIEDALPAGAKASDADGGWQFVSGTGYPAYSGLKSHRRHAEGSQQHFFTEASSPLLAGEGDTLFTYVYLDALRPPKTIMLQFHTKDWNHRAYWGEDLIEHGKGNGADHQWMGELPQTGSWVRLEVPAKQVGINPGDRIDGWAFSQYDGTVYWDHAGLHTMIPQGEEGFASFALWLEFIGATKGAGLPKDLQELASIASKERTDAELEILKNHFLEHVCTETKFVFDALHAQQDKIRKAKNDYEKSIPQSLVSKELKEPRDTFVLVRGEYDKPSEKVTANVPGVLPSIPQGEPMNRLGLAKWLVDPAHPLTARVTVNRFWQQHFGTGLVKTAEDFGTQGDLPSHPRLLDWLAREFIESGWDMKYMHRLLVTSAAFKQASVLTPEALKKDPDNRLISRGPRYRLDAEVLRDSELAISGLLVDKMGGKGVKPYQPEGLWEAVAYPSSTTAKYVQDSGDALYRRSLYTFIKRTSPPPSMATFDAPNRESCTVRRERTNTPLQALNLMNDIQYVEAARRFAERVMEQSKPDLADRLNYAMQLAASRSLKLDELELLTDLYEKHLSTYQQDEDAAKQLIQTGESPVLWKEPAAELASMTMICNLILNLDEVMTLN